ncbi:hypothetical protein ACPB8Q_06735 [Methanocaldococcus indicus]|uniref:hypothetical protein n=1 Tax=Methanocaldococcus indicus TaxID=213231 RepID=UPI003C6CE423
MTVFFNLKYNNSNRLTNDYIYIDIDKFLEICESYRILPDYCYNKIKNYELNIIEDNIYSFYNNILSSMRVSS